MALRWYSTVIDCHDHLAQGEWWAETLDWQIIYRSDSELVAVPGHVNEEMLRTTPWELVGPGLVFVPVPEHKKVKNRLHLDLAPHTSDDRQAEIDRLMDRGATLVEVGLGDEVTWTVLADPEGNEFCVLSARDR